MSLKFANNASVTVSVVIFCSHGIILMIPLRTHLILCMEVYRRTISYILQYTLLLHAMIHILGLKNQRYCYLWWHAFLVIFSTFKCYHFGHFAGLLQLWASKVHSRWYGPWS